VATQADVRRIALSLEGARETRGHFAFTVKVKGKEKGFAWVWMERTAPRKPRVPQPRALAVRVRDVAEKAALLAGDPEVFFTEAHYDGFPAVLVRLPVVTRAQLRRLLEDAWRIMLSPRPGGSPRSSRRRGGGGRAPGR